MGPLLVGAAGLMGSTWPLRALVPAAAPALSRLPPWGTVGGGRQPRRVAPAAWGDCGAVTAAAALSRLLPGVTAGLVRIGV